MSDPVTATQRAYLEAFERWLRSPPGPERDQANRAMNESLALMRLDIPPRITDRDRGNHVRWHVNRSIRQPSCRWCI